MRRGASLQKPKRIGIAVDLPGGPDLVKSINREHIGITSDPDEALAFTSSVRARAGLRKIEAIYKHTSRVSFRVIALDSCG